MYNKRKFNKINDKKVLHKVKKQWVTISLALFMMIGGGAVATHISASADTTNDQNQPQVSVKLGSNRGNKNTITNKAKALHQNLLSKASANRPTYKNVHKQINTTHQGNLITVNNKPAKKVNNINKVGMHKANLYHGYVYNRINKPFRSVRINHTIALHSSVDFDHSQIFGYLHQGQSVKANRMFKQFGHYGNYLRYEINLANKHTAFITGNNDFVSYVVPAKSYRYYQKKASKLVKNANYKNAKKVSKKLYKLNKQRNHNFYKYASLYEMAFNAQQNHKYSVVVDYNARRHTTNITPASNVTSVVSATPTSSSASSIISTPNSNYVPEMPSYVAPVSSNSSVVMPSSSVAPESSSASTESMSSSVSPSSTSSSASKSASSTSTNSSASSKSSNQPALKNGIYNGLNYTYNPANNSINFVSGKLNVTSRGSFLNNSTTPSDIRNANTITFGNIDLNNLSDMNNMLANDQNVKNLDLGNNFNTKSVTNMGNMFQADTALQQLTLGNNFDTSNVNNMDSMFANDGDLTSLVLPTQFNTTNINNTYNSDQSDNMQGMFHGDSDLSSLTIQSPNTKFNNDSDLNSVNDKASWTQQGTNNVINLGDGKSHVGTWIYKPYINNNPANDVLPKNINMKIVNSDVQSQVSNEVADILNGGQQQQPLQQTNSQHMLGATEPVKLGAVNNTSNVLTNNSVYTQLAEDVANGANNSWNESDLTLSPENILGPSNESGTNMFNKTYYNSDNQNKELVRISEENLHLVSINGVGLFSDSASDIGPSDFLPNKIIDDSQSKGDRDFNGMHTIVKYSGPISVSNSSTNSDIANDLVKKFDLSNVSKDQLKYAKNIGLGYKYHNGNLYGILALGPDSDIIDPLCKQVHADANDVNPLTKLSHLSNEFVSDMSNKIEQDGKVKRYALIDGSDIRALATSPVEVVDSVPVLKRAISDVSTKVSSIEKVPFHEAKLNVCDALGKAAHKLQPGEYATFDKLEAATVAAEGSLTIGKVAIPSLGPSLEQITNAIKDYFDGFSKFMNPTPEPNFGLTAPDPTAYANGCAQLLADDTADYISGHGSFSDYEMSNIKGVINEAIKQYCEDYVILTTSRQYGTIYDFEKAPFLNDSATLYYLNSHCGQYIAMPISFIRSLKLVSSQGVKPLGSILTAAFGDHMYYTFPK